MLHTLSRPAAARLHRRVRRSPRAASEAGPASSPLGEQGPRVAVFSSAPYVKEFLQEPLKVAFPGEALFLESRLSRETVSLARGCNVVCLFVNDHASAEVCALLAAEGVELIALRCAGYDRVDVAAAAKHGITVLRVPSYSPNAIAEHAVGLVCCLNRGLHKAYVRTREGNYTLNGLTGMNLEGKTVGVVGTGRIGTLFAKIMGAGFGAKLLATDMLESPEFLALGGRYVPMDELMQRCDIVSLHCPLMPSTHHLINAERIARMKPGVFLINTSRGGLIDTRAAIDGLKAGMIGALGMDVYEAEGDLFFKDRSALGRLERMAGWDEEINVLLSMPNVLVTPHSAFLTVEALDNIASTTVGNITAFQRGLPLENLVKAPVKAS